MANKAAGNVSGTFDLPFLFSSSPNNPYAKKKRIVSDFISPEKASSNKSILEEVKNGDTTPHLVTTINFLAAFCYTPFKIQVDFSSGEFCAVSVNAFRKIICGILHLASIYPMLYFIIAEIILPGENNITQPKLSSQFSHAINAVTVVGSAILITLQFHMFWRGQSQLLSIINQLKVNHESSRVKRKAEKFIFIIMFLIGHTSQIYMFMRIYDFDFPNELKNVMSLEINLILLSVRNTILALIFVYALPFTYFAYSLLVTLCLSLNGVKREFSTRMVNSIRDKDFNTGFHHYMKLRTITGDITKTFGFYILLYYLITVSYLAKLPESSLWADSSSIVSLMTFLMTGTIMWLASAEFHMSVHDTVQNWAAHMQDLDDVEVDARIRLLGIVNDNMLDPIGVSCKFFTITYAFLGSMLGLIVTYGIIVFQMQMKTTGTTPPAPAPLSTKITEIFHTFNGSGNEYSTISTL